MANQVGLCAEYGRSGVARDYAEAVRYYRLGAAQGFGPAICNLADKYEHGNGVPQDLAEALKLYLQAAEKNVTAAKFSLGMMYKEGRGVPLDAETAVRWLKDAAKVGWRDAKTELRTMPESDYGKAAQLLDQARSARAGTGAMPDAKTLHSAALDVYEPDDDEACRLCFALQQLAADMDHPHAIYQLAFMHQIGRGTATDIARAIALYERAASLHDDYAPLTLAELYEAGELVPPDPAQARRWYEIAAARGDTKAQFKLGQRETPHRTIEEMGLSIMLPSRRSAATPKKQPWWKLW